MKTANAKESIKMLLMILFPLFIGILLSHFVFQISHVSGCSMDPTIKDGNYVFVKKWSHNYHRGQIIIAKNEGIELIKRIAGVPGDTVKFKDNTLYVNDEEVKFYDYHGIKAKKFDKVTLKKDQYLIIGDNFKKSYDGRYFGPINKKQIQGIVR